ncbi:hypothetical protein Glove_248g36 [Diversispora epigaea]|uniref:Uncharacterized protein n=1 Tax=Diversispora epigaea TaxID=1348612 RepID=A0A397ICK6_9GLOM|nr:hypothetical protein Glove_248g36 [Diversispora epigaea]
METILMLCILFFKNHRDNCADVNTFWNAVEAIQTEQEELEITKIGAIQSIFKGATTYTDEVFITAVENLKNDRKRSLGKLDREPRKIK